MVVQLGMMRRVKVWSMDIDLKLLPYGLRCVFEHMEFEYAMRVLQEYQGQMFFIPEYPNESHVIVKVFGQSLAEHLADKMPKQHWQVPMISKVLKQVRNQRICKALDNHTHSIQQLVKKYKLTRQQITSIYREHRSCDAQLGLFS